jgi:lysophospholipase L1-like esterase
MMKITRVFLLVLSATYAATASAAIVPRLMSGESLKVCAIGTSLTVFRGSQVPDWGWFEQSGAWLNSLYPNQVTLSNRAVGGAFSSSAPPTYPRGGFLQLGDVLANDNPDAIFIEFAINDAINGLMSVAQSKSNLQTMINSIKTWSSQHGKNVDIVISTMNNCGPTLDATRSNLAAFYQGYRDVAKNNGLLLIDNYPNWVNLYNSNFAQWQAYVPDDIHPSSAGATAIILPQVKASLMSQVPEPSTWVLLVVAGLALVRRRWRKPE